VMFPCIVVRTKHEDHLLRSLYFSRFDSGVVPMWQQVFK
jgi:hypothetical protein